MTLTVRGWQDLVLSVMGVVVLAGAVAGVLLVSRTDGVTRELTNHIEPAGVAAYQLQAALRDQETAVRGYALAADRQFLRPYTDGQRAEALAAERIRSYVADRTDLIADLDAIERAASAWRTGYAEPLIARVIPGRPEATAAVAVDGEAEFERLRGLFDVQNQNLGQARAAALDELAQVRGWRDGVMIAMIVAFFVMTLLLAVLVRRTVTRPLSALASACRRMSQGKFSERVIGRGPKDIRAIASDVDDMRQRIVEELEAARSAGIALDEQAVELRRSNAELEQFAYVASHDLQEPLRKVASFCQLLEKRYGDQLDERGVEYIGFAVDGAKRMQVLINDLLTFSRVGRLNATHTEVDLNAVVASALRNLATAIDESGAEVVLPSRPLPQVDGDPTLLTMVWQNLIGNAVKFRSENISPRIVVDFVEGTGENSENWVFSVADNGIGIGQEFVDKVFVIFQRLHGRDSYGGTGIGLALSKKIVEHHGGAIWIDTSYTGGTRFCFTLPVTPTTVPDGMPAAQLEGNSP
ncbi:ATP-binding protein [Mycobacterium sp. 21AC1]|uniref:sensor histidine kinase n=1 Tax=[Mycobacterium] appelbergii TaxID=2939269 RepID=UPI00293908E2|nr:ATP-binding protein [Mycobacterium sp. 21AC1]MDV3128854.1 ATP-binding protein [Mycobacterium sp. 21AC1]